MNFVYHHRTGGRGAEGLHIMSMVRALEAQGHTVAICSPPGVDPSATAGAPPLDKGAAPQRGIGRLWQWLSRRAPQLVFEVAELAYNVYAFRRVRAELRRNPGAAYYERYAFFLFAGVLTAKRRGRPVILEVNEIAGIERARGLVLTALARRLERFVFRRADRIVTVSTYLKAGIVRRGAAPEKVIVLPNGIDPERFRERTGAAVREKHGFNGCTVVGFVGWFDYWDRLECLVDAVAEVRAANSDVRLLLVGDGPVTPRLAERIESRGLGAAAVLAGPVPRELVPDHIDSMDICVLPDSSAFGSPMVLFEFMAMGKPIVAADLPPIREVLVHGATGLVVRRGCVDALATAIARLHGDAALRRRLGDQARTYVFEQRTWAANAARVLEMTKQIESGRS